MIEAKDFSERKTGQERWGGQSLVKENAPGKGLGKKQEAVQETLPEPEEAQEDENPCWYHICSQGLEGVDLFPDENAFIVGVNKFAVAFKLFGEEVEVAILVLVSNHFHSLVWGRKSDVIRCAERYKKTISMYYSHRFGTSKVMCRVRVKVERVDSEEYLKNVIGYILNNPRKHRETNNPFLNISTRRGTRRFCVQGLWTFLHGGNRRLWEQAAVSLEHGNFTPMGWLHSHLLFHPVAWSRLSGQSALSLTW